MKSFGIFFIILASFITINLWFISKQQLSDITNDPYRSLSQVLALLGIVFMAITLMLSTRLHRLEELFDGLDRMYLVHHIVGSVAFVFLLHHPLLLAIKSLPQFNLASLYIFPGNNLSYDLGIFGLYCMLFATIFIVFIKLPYHIWKLSHKLMGLAFLLGSLHALFIPSDISQNMILRIWVLIFIVLGLLSAFYIIFLYNTIGPKYIYCIKKIDQSTDIVNVYLMPIGRKLDFSPGQFIYISFKNEFVGEEHHPFSLSSAPGAESIRISVKKLGDFTHKLPLLQENEKVHVYGPYGKFGDWYKKRRESLILIAGGIGITPFLGMLKQNPPPLNKKITLFYCLRKRSEAVFLEEIKKNIENNPYINLHIWCSEESGRLNANKIRELLGEVNRNLIQVCGPPAMMESYKKQFMKQGISEKDIKLESFSQL